MILVYVDDSGGRAPFIEGKSDPVRDSVYVLAACAIEESRWRVFNDSMESVKFKYGKISCERRGVSNIEITDMELKCATMNNLRERQKKSPFLAALTDEEIMALRNDAFDCAESHGATFLAMVVNKAAFDRKGMSDAHRIAYKGIMVAVKHHMEKHHANQKAMIVMDESDRTTHEATREIHIHSMIGASRDGHGYENIIEYPLFTDSKLSNGIQMADLCAGCLFHAFSRRNFKGMRLRSLVKNHFLRGRIYNAPESDLFEGFDAEFKHPSRRKKMTDGKIPVGLILEK